MKITAAEILEEAAKTFEERNAVYKDNAEMVSKVMQAFHPAGLFIQDDDHHMMHLWYLVIVKLTRFVKSGMKHQDSLRDAAVYLAMIEAINFNEKGEKQ